MFLLSSNLVHVQSVLYILLEYILHILIYIHHMKCVKLLILQTLEQGWVHYLKVREHLDKAITATHFLLSPLIKMIPFGLLKLPKRLPLGGGMWFLTWENWIRSPFSCSHVSQTLNEVEFDWIIHCRKGKPLPNEMGPEWWPPSLQ